MCMRREPFYIDRFRSESRGFHGFHEIIMLSNQALMLY
jgi:hypothetical protein